MYKQALYSRFDEACYFKSKVISLSHNRPSKSWLLPISCSNQIIMLALPNDVWLRYWGLGDQVILVRWWWLNEIGDRRVSECGTKGMMQWLLIVVKMDLFLDKVWPIRLCSHLQVVGVPILLLLEANLGLKRGCGIRNVFVVTLLGCGGKLLTHQERFYFILIGCLNVILRLDCLVGFLCYAARIL